MLFGASAPLAKGLLVGVNPWLLAGLLYLGSGVGLSVYRMVRQPPPVELQLGERCWLAGAIVAGGIIGPVLLMFGLSAMPASAVALLLNAEAVFTALLAWFAFKENVDRRIALGMTTIVGGAVVLSWPDEVRFANLWPALAVLGACLAWSIDNNLTRKVSLSDATWIAAVKGMVAGTLNLILAFAQGATLPPLPNVALAMMLGLLAYGVSLVWFIIGLRHLGTARTGAYFSVAPFFGAALAVPWLGETVTTRFVTAGALMALGVWLHVTEQHCHEHSHEAMEHEHEHGHDEHHQHEHKEPVWLGTKHRHWHRHTPVIHSHRHFPDAHHRHTHGWYSVE